MPSPEVKLPSNKSIMERHAERLGVTSETWHREAYIRKEGNEWCVKSESGKNMGCYDSEAGAKKRLQQIEYFKHKGELKTEAQDKEEKECPFKMGQRVIVKDDPSFFATIINFTGEDEIVVQDSKGNILTKKHSEIKRVSEKLAKLYSKGGNELYLDEETGEFIKESQEEVGTEEFEDVYHPRMKETKEQYAYVNVYLHSLGYGGSEEGGWYYDVYEPVKSYKVRSIGEGRELIEKLKDEYPNLNEGKDEEGRSYTSVIAGDSYEAYVEDKKFESATKSKPVYSKKSEGHEKKAQADDYWGGRFKERVPAPKVKYIYKQDPGSGFIREYQESIPLRGVIETGVVIPETSIPKDIPRCAEHGRWHCPDCRGLKEARNTDHYNSPPEIITTDESADDLPDVKLSPAEKESRMRKVIRNPAIEVKPRKRILQRD